METQESRSTPDLLDYLGILWRRKWIILSFAIVTPLVVYLLSSFKTPVYEASADVLVNRQRQAISGIVDPTLREPLRAIKTQAQLARLPNVASRVVGAAGLDDRGRFEFLAQSAVDADGGTDLITFRVTDPNPGIATRLATEYARQYIAYRAELDTAAVRRAIAAFNAQLRKVDSTDVQATLRASLADKLQELETALTLQTSNATLVKPALGAVQIAPRPARSAKLALLLAVAVGLGLAALIELLDVRIRTADEIADELGLPLIGRLPEASRVRSAGTLAMLDPSDGHETEAFRILRTNFEFVNLDRRHQSVMITSAVGDEGKSTTIANLAAALAFAGRRVLLVDLDLRRPSISDLFGLELQPGITDLVLGHAGLDDVCHVWRVSPRGRRSLPMSLHTSSTSSANSDGGSDEGTLQIITAGTTPPDPGELLAGRALPETLQSLRRLADIVLINSPPILLAGDAFSLSSHVDGLVFVAHIEAYSRKYTHEIRRLLASSPASKLGLVVIDTTVDLLRTYGYGERGPSDVELQVVGRT